MEAWINIAGIIDRLITYPNCSVITLGCNSAPLTYGSTLSSSAPALAGRHSTLSSQTLVSTTFCSFTKTTYFL